VPSEPSKLRKERSRRWDISCSTEEHDAIAKKLRSNTLDNFIVADDDADDDDADDDSLFETFGYALLTPMGMYATTYKLLLS